jgi:hypothetical protein
MPSVKALSGEFSGAFADLGTFLPIVLGVVGERGLDVIWPRFLNRRRPQWRRRIPCPHMAQNTLDHRGSFSEYRIGYQR